MGKAKELADNLWAIQESGQLDKLDELAHPDAEFVLPGGIRLRGPEQLRPLLESYRTAFPDMHHNVVDYIEADDGIAVELHITATHTGDMPTPSGETLTATGKSVTWDSVDVIRLRDDKVASWHVYFDQASFLAQLGLMLA
jgi:steroid delta-isomerase-like uncharacterized protein